MLDAVFTASGLPTGEYVRQNRQLNARGQRYDTNVGMMITYMQKAGITCYDHINYICSFYWGWTLPNIEHLVPTIMSDYAKTQAVRSQLSVSQRGTRSNIPKNLRLALHLQKRGHNCTFEDFKMPKDIDKYMPGWHEMCRLSGVPELQ